MMPNNRDNSDDNDVNEQRELNRIKSPESIDSSHQDIFFLETNEKQSNVENKSIECDNGRSTRHSTIDQPSPRSTKSTLNSSTNQLPKFGITPPNYISLDEIMKTANEMNRLALVNEIVLDKDFKLERRSTDPNRLESVIRETMKKAFWDIVAEEFNQNPPNYRQAITLMTEIKETLLLFLMPQHSQLKNAIEETLDIELIEQKITNEIFEFKDYAKFVLSVCGRLCCPARDEMISKLNEITDTIPLIRGIFELLEIMRIDFANFYIKQFRPHIQLTSVEYEREKFENLMKSHRKYNIDVLEFTTKWIKRNYESLDLTQESDMKTLFSKVMISSYLDLLQSIQPGFDCYSALIDEKKTNDETMTVQDDYPETLLFLREKIESVREKVFKITYISSLFVVTFATIGEPLQSIKDFRIKLKNELEILMQSDEKRKLPLQYLNNDGMKSILESASLQIVESIQKAAEQFGVANDHQMLRKEKLDSLRYQITELVSPSNRIRSVMERRVLEFIERVITSPSSQNSGLILVPNGLSTFYDDLVQISSLFTRLVSYNRAVYSPHYTKIIAKLAQNKHFISDIDLKTIEKSFYD